MSASGLEALTRLAAGPTPDVYAVRSLHARPPGADVFARIAGQWPGLEGRMVFMTGGAFTEVARDFLAR
ncbi:MAG: hypothetical protein U0235_02820 [Polyangiaceae bacterium]